MRKRYENQEFIYPWAAHGPFGHDTTPAFLPRHVTLSWLIHNHCTRHPGSTNQQTRYDFVVFFYSINYYLQIDDRPLQWDDERPPPVRRRRARTHDDEDEGQQGLQEYRARALRLSDVRVSFFSFVIYILPTTLHVDLNRHHHHHQYNEAVGVFFFLLYLFTLLTTKWEGTAGIGKEMRETKENGQPGARYVYGRVPSPRYLFFIFFSCSTNDCLQTTCTKG